jgi:hypothetical protein
MHLPSTRGIPYDQVRSRSLHRSEPAVLLLLSSKNGNRILALASMLLIASAGWAQQSPPAASFLSDAQPSAQVPPSTTAAVDASGRAGAATRGLQVLTLARCLFPCLTSS